MVAPKRKRKATYRDVLAAPEHKVAEIVDGELHVSPRPASRHTLSMSKLGALLISSFDFGHGGGPGGWIIMVEPELHFGKDVVVPDLAGWRRERMPHVEDVNYFTLAPDWICEGLSKSTVKLDRVTKMRVYAKAGVEFAWLLDARLLTLEVYRRVEDNWQLVDLYADGQVIRAVPFEAIELSLADLWRDLPTRAGEAVGVYSQY